MDISKILQFTEIADSLFSEYHNMDKITTIKDRYKDGIHRWGNMISYFDVEDKIPPKLLNAELFDLSSGEKNVPMESSLINDLFRSVKREANLDQLYETTPPDRYAHYRSEITNIPQEDWGFDEKTFVHKVLDKYMDKAGTLRDQHLPEELFLKKGDGSLKSIGPYKLVEMLAMEYPEDPFEQFDFWKQGGVGNEILNALTTGKAKSQEDKILEYIRNL
tara:strand:+ start:574 stop:1230 length:657 start_codon:yes stop_codon:yes gene_type:complete